MSDEQLRQSLEDLRSGLERLESEEARIRERLDALFSGVETRLEKPEDTTYHQSLVQDLRQSVSQFEVSHPSATAILNQVMVTLGNMGIRLDVLISIMATGMPLNHRGMRAGALQPLDFRDHAS